MYSQRNGLLDGGDDRTVCAMPFESSARRLMILLVERCPVNARIVEIGRTVTVSGDDSATCVPWPKLSDVVVSVVTKF